jgi:hypothetical protein
MKKLIVFLMPAIFALTSCSHNEPKTSTSENIPPPVPRVEAVKPAIVQKPEQAAEADLTIINKEIAVTPKIEPAISDRLKGDVTMPEEPPVPQAPPVNEFTISSTGDTAIYAEQGTRVYIKTESFRFDDGSPVTGPVVINIKEYYKKSDILLADLSTSSNGQLLETGGMLYITATSEGENVELRKDKSLTVYFPNAGNANRQMNLFYPGASSTPASVTDWVIDNKSLFNKTRYISLRGFYWSGTVGRVYSPHAGKTFLETGYYWNPEGNNNGDYSFSKAAMDEVGLASIRVEFTIDTDGKVKSPVFRNRISESTKDELLSFLENLPELTPANDNKGNHIERSGVLILSSAEVVPKNPDKAEFKNAFDKKYAGFEARNVKNMDEEELSYYIFSVANLGWINCDRFQEIAKRTEYIVKVNDDGDIKIKMVFKDIDGVLIAEEENGKYIFHEVPVGRRVTIVAIKNSGENLQTAFADLTISDKPLEDLAFKETTLAELRSDLEKLN